MSLLASLPEFLADVAKDDWVVFAKRLSANDTGQTASHQAGFYIPREVAVAINSAFADPNAHNPKLHLEYRLLSHAVKASPTLTYYNNRLQGGTRDECRITGFGGTSFPLQQPASTGALLLTAFRAGTPEAVGWMARNLEDEDLLEDLMGPVLPGTIAWLTQDTEGHRRLHESSLATGEDCHPDFALLPVSWQSAFPAPAEVSAVAAVRANADGLNPDRRLLKRYRCEYELFKVVEAARTLPLIKDGFPSMDLFLAQAQTVLQRRKARAGRSLELQIKRVFDEERVEYAYGAEIDHGNLPDFLFPSVSAYVGAGGPSSRLRMLAVKTSLKDRWRQVLEEADWIPHKHLFTLAEGVSMPQFEQISHAGLTLVVPRENVVKFPEAAQPSLLDLDDFIRLL